MSKKSKLIAHEVPKPVDNKSIMERVAELPPEQRNEMIDKIVEKYCGGDETRLKYTWELWRRGNQWLPEHDEWRTCAFLAGRGFGKTRVGGEIVRHMVENGLAKRVGIIAPTAHDTVAVVLYGESGLLNISPPWFMPKHHPTSKKVSWPNGAVAYLFSAEDPDSLRGHQFDFIWADELAAWSKGKRVWEQAIFTLRLGHRPKAVVTTTPRANELIKSIVGDPKTWTITGTTEENKANIDIEQMTTLFKGTRLGKQELEGQILEEVEGALWKQDWIDKNRVQLKDLDKIPEFLYIAMAIDPAMTANKNSDETGICVAAYGTDDKYYILYADSHKDTPHEWAKRALGLYDDFVASSIVVETNQGGDLVLQNLQRIRPDVAVTGIHAKKGKAEAIDSPILTVDGWKTFGELNNNDMVFDHMGKSVTIETLPIHESECARVTFSDGTSNVYALEHEWRVLPSHSVRKFTNDQRVEKDWVRWRTAGQGKYPSRALDDAGRLEAKRLRDTGKSYKEIAEILGCPRGSVFGVVNRDLNNNTCIQFVEKTTREMMEDMANGKEYAIPMSPPLQMDNSSLIDPYLLGIWASDGCVGSSSIAQKTPDDTERIMEELKNRGFDVYLRDSLICVRNMRWFFSQRMKKEIHTDEWMIREDERLDLIRGILDGDGTRPNNVCVKLSQSGYRLQTVLEPTVDAMRSLGWKVSTPHYKQTYREPAYTVSINPTVLDCTMLPRKQINVIPHSSRYRTITSIEPVGIQTVRCISVDNESHMYLSGKGLVPTHNSLRAEPVAHLYELGKVKHVGTHPKAESQMTEFNPISNPEGSDDIVDSLTYACLALMEKAMVNAVYRPAVGGLRHKLINYRAR